MAQSKPKGELDDLLKIVERLPFFGTLKGELTHLHELLYRRRAPRLLVVGESSSGRTALANALLGSAALPLSPSPIAPRDAWVRIDASGRHLDWLESDFSVPLDAARRFKLRKALVESAPDVWVLVIRAHEQDQDVQAFERAWPALSGLWEELGIERPKMVTVLTFADRISPTADGETSFSADALARIDARTQALKTRLEAILGTRISRPVPAGKADAASEDAIERWNVSELADALLESLPNETKVEAVRALPVRDEHRRELARSIINHVSAAAVTVGLMPVPFSDAAILLPLQGVMVSAIAYLGGQPWDVRAGIEWLGSVGVIGGAALGLRWGAQQLVKLIPGAGSLVSGSVAGAGTLAIGRSAMAYFIDGPGRRKFAGALPPESSSAKEA